MATVKAPKETAYKSAYSDTINSLVDRAVNREAFNYDPATDAAYQSYARQYMRMGDEAARDTLADVSAQSGGLASSYAVTAAQQARDQYNQALTDKIPSLMEAAYAKYRDEYNDTLAGISTLQGLDDSMYNRYATDREYNRGVYESDRDFQESVRQYNQNYDLDKNSAEFERMLNTWTTLGYATKKVAQYFGVKEGTMTNDASYRAAQLALQQSSGGRGGGGRSGGRGRGYSSSSSEDKYGTYYENPSGSIYDDDPYHQALHVGSQKLNNGASKEQVRNYVDSIKGLTADERDRLYYALGIGNSKQDYHAQAKDSYAGPNKAYNY